MFEDFRGHWDQFLTLTRIKELLKITVDIRQWSLLLLSRHERHTVKMLHEEEEPCDSEEEQIEARIQEHMNTGKEI
jgi:hypothetical protein